MLEVSCFRRFFVDFESTLPYLSRPDHSATIAQALKTASEAATSHKVAMRRPLKISPCEAGSFRNRGIA
jgi:hypothetical protein